MEYYVYGFMDTEIHTYLLVRDAWFTFYAESRLNVVCWSFLNVYVTNSVDPDQTAPLGEG